MVLTDGRNQDHELKTYVGAPSYEDMQSLWELDVEIGDYETEFVDAELEFNYVANLQNGDEELTVKYTGGFLGPKEVYKTDFEEREWPELEAELEDMDSLNRRV